MHIKIPPFFVYYFIMPQKAHVIHWVRLDRYSSIEEAYQDGKNCLEFFLSKVHIGKVWVFVFDLFGGYIKYVFFYLYVFLFILIFLQFRISGPGYLLDL